mgnify:CR=1 FL=1
MKESYQKIYVVWQDPKSRRHFPVGELSYVHNDHEVYHFNYIYGVGEAQKFGFQPFPGFPELEITYVSPELFPFFQNRILLSSREEYEAFVTSLGLSPSNAKPIDILARSGGRRATDSVEVFAPADIKETDDANFNIAQYYFLLHGLSHMRDCVQSLVADLKVGDPLFIMHDIQNPVDPEALSLRTKNYCSIGFVPRYLLDDMWRLLHEQTDLKFYIYKVNKPPTPIQQRIVCKLEAKVQKDFISCRSEAYKPYKDFAKI